MKYKNKNLNAPFWPALKRQVTIFNKTSVIVFVIVIVLIIFISNNDLYSQAHDLKNSKWKLKKLENKDNRELIYPSKYYFVSFQDGNFKYSLERNICRGKYVFIDKNKIEIKIKGCTRVCCDGDISGMLNYNGIFNVELVGDSLTLSSRKRVYLFERDYRQDG